jgi:hypothetical protein
MAQSRGTSNDQSASASPGGVAWAIASSSGITDSACDLYWLTSAVS